MFRRAFTLVVSLVALSVSAQEPDGLHQVSGPNHPPASANITTNSEGARLAPTLNRDLSCVGEGSIIYDDGTFENGLQPGSNITLDGGMVMRFDPNGAVDKLNTFCVCFTTISVIDTTILFDFVLFDDNGAGGSPGTELARIPASAVGVAVNPGRTMFTYDLTNQNVVPPVGNFYVGVGSWNTIFDGEFFLCSDESASTPLRRAYVTNDDPTGWNEVAPLAPNYRALGIRVEAGTAAPTLSSVSGLIVPGFFADTSPGGQSTLFAIRNRAGGARQVTIDYYGMDIDNGPIRSNVFNIAAQQTLTQDVSNNTNGLPVVDGIATGMVVINEGNGGAASIEGDYFQVDFPNDFASGDRLVRPDDMCSRQEIRFVNFGSGSKLRILLDDPPVSGPAFTWTAVNEAGTQIGQGSVNTSDNLILMDFSDLVAANFGTLIVDFSNSGRGWMSAAYSAFGRFSLELNGACTAQ